MTTLDENLDALDAWLADFVDKPGASCVPDWLDALRSLRAAAHRPTDLRPSLADGDHRHDGFSRFFAFRPHHAACKPLIGLSDVVTWVCVPECSQANMALVKAE